VSRSADEIYRNDCVIPKFKQSNLGLGLYNEREEGPTEGFGVSRRSGRGHAAKQYQEQVLDIMHEFYMEMVEERRQVVFQQDSASSHKAKLTLQWPELN
jgi:hypothetical protein